MKKIKKCSLLFVLTSLIFSCTQENNFEEEVNTNKDLLVGKYNSENRNISRRNMPVYAKDKLIVQYAPGTSDSVKNDLRDMFGTTSYELCAHCNDDSIELWFFGNGIDIEPKKTAIEQGSGGGVEAIVDVDYEFTFGVDLSNPNLGTITDYSYMPYVKPINNGVTIAVLDTGIAPTIGEDTSPVFTAPFLYNASDDGNALIESGWDFVNDDNNCFDDNNGRHGTVVSSIITKILNESVPTVPHQIMPLKVCNEYGRASYFNFLCATSFGLEHAEILQMSLGWYDDGFGDFLNTIMSTLIEANPNALIITSAGNLESNNDYYAHYPSGYVHDNIIAVAASNKLVTSDAYFDASNIAWFSNYGNESVDVFAKGENIPFLGYEMQGTSFAAPVVTAVVARIKNSNPSYNSNELKTQLINSGINCPLSFDTLKKVKYNKIILP
ncbi:S8 family serine peptidase [Flavobacterium jejuense]|uniref:S8 family serine peptidase n=1 Tax=Flavobacterium jejuense TaxID=1544455 RepID=A0ABX0IQ04_9FLAO|nr:S8 family serine peptidase [Flavobacterium jejuense]NHN25778.1 S8 family serine peptidase [Flavobacterium jejuense]